MYVSSISVLQAILHWLVPRVWETDRHDCPSLNSAGQPRFWLRSLHHHAF